MRKVLMVAAVLAVGLVLSYGLTAAAEPEKSEAAVKGEPAKAGKALVTSNVVWEKQFKEKIFGKEVEAWARVVEENTKYYVELEAKGKRERWELGDKCYEVSFNVGLEAKVRLCTSDVKFEGNNLKSFKAKVELCVEAFGKEKCVTVYEQTIGVNKVADGYETTLAEFPFDTK